VYRFLEYDRKDTLPAAVDVYDKAVSLGVISKTFGLAGLRIGWLVINRKELFDKVAGFKDYTTICSSAPSEILSVIALRNKEKIIRRNLEIIKNNLTVLNKFFARCSQMFSWTRPRAGCIAFPRLVRQTSSEKFCQKVLCESGVLLLPSSKYSFGDKHFRIGYGRTNFKEGLLRLERFLI
jgi:aspartate/methionine/tyrosine aminotransferase